MRILFLWILATSVRGKEEEQEREKERTNARKRQGTKERSIGCCGRTLEEVGRGGGRSRMLLQDPQTRIPLPSLARARPERVRDEMTRGEIEEKGRRFIGITMKLRDAGVIDGEVIVTGVADRVDPRDANSSP